MPLEVTPPRGSYLVVSHFFAILALLAMLTAGWWLVPADVESIPLCLFKSITRLECPGCGLTRSFLRMARGDIMGAITYNAAGPLLYLAFLLVFVEKSIGLFTRKLKFSWPVWLVTFYSSFVLVIMLSQWIWRVFLIDNDP